MVINLVSQYIFTAIKRIFSILRNLFNLCFYADFRGIVSLGALQWDLRGISENVVIFLSLGFCCSQFTNIAVS